MILERNDVDVSNLGIGRHGEPNLIAAFMHVSFDPSQIVKHKKVGVVNNYDKHNLAYFQNIKLTVMDEHFVKAYC